MSEYIEVGQPLQFTDPNTPTRVGEIVENVSDIYNIPSPRLGMQVFVKNEKKSFVITSLKSKTIGGVDVPEAAVEAFEPVGAKSITWNNDTDQSNMNDFVVAGVYDIKGERTRENDNLPIPNTGGGHTFNARLTVLDSSITGSGNSDDKCITQVLSFCNRLGQGEVYIRTGKGSSLDSLTWEKWSTLQRNVNVEQVDNLDNLKDNGIYSGVWTKGSYNAYPLTFVCIVINDYFIGTAPRRISQFVYGLSKFDGSVVYQSRVWDDSKGMWGNWEILNQKEIASMISAEIKKVTDGIDPNKIDSLKDIITWIEEHGDVAGIFAVIEGLYDELGREIDARISVDNDTRGKGVLFGDFSNRQTTADEVVIGYKNIAQNAEGAFSIPAATTEKAGVMSAEDKAKLTELDQKVENLTIVGGGSGVIDGESSADFEIADENGNVLVRFAHGGIQTQNFNSQSRIATNIHYTEGQTFCMIGASFAEAVSNGWYERACETLGVTPINLAKSGTSIITDANKYKNGSLWTAAQFEQIDVLCIMHVHNQDVADATDILDDYANYSSFTYATAYDYIIRRYREDCYTQRLVPGSRHYGTTTGKPCQILLMTHWHDARTIYNNSIRRLAEKWRLPLVALDDNIGFTKNQPMRNGTQVSVIQSRDGNNTETIDGVVYGWHPAPGDTYIQSKIADIFVSTIK